jgi:hypothetical protein
LMNRWRPRSKVTGEVTDYGPVFNLEVRHFQVSSFPSQSDY